MKKRAFRRKRISENSQAGKKENERKRKKRKFFKNRN